MPKSCWCRKLEFDVHARACVRTNPYCVQYWYRRGILSSTRERVLCIKHVPFGEYALGLQYTSEKAVQFCNNVFIVLPPYIIILCTCM
eukprot:COSAG01_NODE_260_length_20041_cov_15.896249_2_plen_88_part_00